MNKIPCAAFAVVCLLASLVAWADTTLSWREEVLQQDGNKVIAERTIWLRGNREIGQDPPVGDQTISFELPPLHKKVTWTDAFSPDIGRGNLSPLLLEVKEAVAYLVAYPTNCLAYNKWDRPNPSYVVFKYAGGEWMRIALNELPAEVQRPNLVFSQPEREARPGALISAEAIRSLYQGYERKEFKQIVRTPVANPRGGECPEMFTDGKGSWIGINPFRKQPDRASCERVCTLQRVDAAHCPCKSLFPTAQ